MFPLNFFELIALILNLSVFYLILLYFKYDKNIRASLFKRGSIIFVLIIIIYSLIVRFVYQNTNKFNNGVHEVSFVPTLPIKSNNPSLFSLMYLKYKTDSNGFINETPHVSFYGFPVLTSIRQETISLIEIDKKKGTSTFTVTISASCIFIISTFSVYDITISKDGTVAIKTISNYTKSFQ